MKSEKIYRLCNTDPAICILFRIINSTSASIESSIDSNLYTKIWSVLCTKMINSYSARVKDYIYDK